MFLFSAFIYLRLLSSSLFFFTGHSLQFNRHQETFPAISLKIEIFTLRPFFFSFMTTSAPIPRIEIFTFPPKRMIREHAMLRSLGDILTHQHHHRGQTGNHVELKAAPTS
ncbi:unnamed protein product [Cuscuta epithymum]|uniref:Secreted protein n=1 Tax=Cuscuta epithymum TaxID=186058 RepID=A0AAV0ELF6_9ASTE|nr:unnamed protein product [Cuscuta epithymum]